MAYKIIRRFIPLAFLATALCGLVYLVVQQSLRQSANDPQIQMAEDAAAQLQASSSMQAVIPAGKVNINQSLAPYIIVYDGSGNPIAGNGLLNGTLPKLPDGVFGVATQTGEDRITWQPQSGVREAVIVTRLHHPAQLTGLPTFVMVGRSLREIEIREHETGFEVCMVWLVTIIGLLLLEIIFAFGETRWMKKK